MGSSARSPLIPRSQVLDVLKNLNIREGLFSEEEIKELENGYSVSETESERTSGASSQLDALGSVNSPPNDFDYRQSRGHYLPSHQDRVTEDRLRLEQHRSLVNAEIGSIKSKYIKKLTGLERQIDTLRHEKSELQHLLDQQKQTFKLQLLNQERQTQEQFAQLRDQQLKLQGQVPNFKEKLEMYKKEFSQGTLLIGEDSYVELKGRREEKLSLKEFIQVKVYEALAKYQHEIHLLRQENEELAGDQVKLQLEVDKSTREANSYKKMSKEREEDHRRRVDTLERRITELEQDNHRLSNQHRVLLDKGLTQKDLDGRFKELEIEHRTLQQRHKMLEDQLAKIQDLKLEGEKRNDSLRREIDLLQQDKTFLTRENVSLEERLKRVEDKLDRTDTELLEAKRAAQKYMDRVLATNDEVKSRFEQQYTQEINELKERHARELDRAKEQLTEIAEKRIEYMRERKEELERRCLKLEQDYKDKNTSYDELLVEYRSLQKQCDEEIGRLKLGVLSKSDELTRIMHLYEDNMVMVKDLKIENEALTSKIEVLKTEYYKLEGVNRQGTADIRAELAVCKERLGNYEMIEKELDQAIMHVANNENIEGQVDNIGNAIIQTITSAPTTAKRRIQQSLLLANRLQIKQRECESLNQEIRALKEKIDNQEAEVKFSKRMLEKTNQPYSYMIQDVERTEKELNSALKKIKVLEDEIRKLKKDNEQLALQKRGLNDDLQKLLVKRQEIESLQIALQGIIQHSSAKKIDIEELKHKLADSIRSSKFKNESIGGKENFMRKMNGSRSKSPGHFNHTNTMLGGSLDEVPYRGSPVKQSQAEPEGAPAWYKALKKNIAK